MIAKLRKKFILVAMCSMAVVLFVIVGTLNLVSYVNMVNKADAILELLAENNAMFPVMPDRFGPDIIPHGVPPVDAKMRKMSPETPYETRFFSVKMSAKGMVLSVDTGKIAAVATEDAIVYARKILQSGKKCGFYGSYRYKVVNETDSVMIVFVDRGRELTSVRTLAVTSISMSLLGLLAVFVLVVIFSKRVFRPVAASYEKQKHFITDASHELKTPLTIISANVEVLEMELAEQEENTWIKSIKNQVARLSSLVEQMVDLSRMDESNELPDAADFVLADAVQETAELFRPLAEGKGMHLEIVVEGDAIYHGDEKRIRQMVSLLMDNAVKYAQEQGSIKVSLMPKGKRYQLMVWNTVEEIPQGRLDILFERFYRLDSSRNSRTGGSGIGLSIVKSIVEAHKGKIFAKSEDGKSLQILIVL